MNIAKKDDVKNFWEAKVCGATYGRRKEDDIDLYLMAQARYRLEPYIPPFADFSSACGKRLLEIGVGGGVDFSCWIVGGALATGVDLTEAGVRMTRRRMAELDFPEDRYRLLVSDAENLAFADNSFDLVYSWGVLHHSPDTRRAFREVHRVLKPGGLFKGMIYHLHCPICFMFWMRYSLLTGRPFKSPRKAVFDNLESPGTKVYTVPEARDLLSAAGFRDITITTRLSHGDLLLINRSKRYQSWVYRIAWKLYPRWLIKRLGDGWGGNLMFQAAK